MEFKNLILQIQVCSFSINTFPVLAADGSSSYKSSLVFSNEPLITRQKDAERIAYT